MRRRIFVPFSVVPTYGAVRRRIPALFSVVCVCQTVTPSHPRSGFASYEHSYSAMRQRRIFVPLSVVEDYAAMRRRILVLFTLIVCDRL